MQGLDNSSGHDLYVQVSVAVINGTNQYSIEHMEDPVQLFASSLAIPCVRGLLLVCFPFSLPAHLASYCRSPVNCLMHMCSAELTMLLGFLTPDESTQGLGTAEAHREGKPGVLLHRPGSRSCDRRSRKLEHSSIDCRYWRCMILSDKNLLKEIEFPDVLAPIPGILRPPQANDTNLGQKLAEAVSPLMPLSSSAFLQIRTIQETMHLLCIVNNP